MPANSPAGAIADTDSFTYDDSGRMLTAESQRYTNEVSYTYDNAGRKVTESLEIANQTYTTTTNYNNLGQISGYVYPDGTVVDRAYTDRGQLHTISVAGSVIDTRTYDDGGRMLTSAYANGVSESRSYNSDNTLSSISFTGAPIGNLSYGWDNNKNKTSESITGTMSGYGFDVGFNGYDSEDRLTNWNRSDFQLNQSWNLSAVGDWNTFTENGSTQNRTHGPTHELLTAAGQAITHDAKGNTTSIPAILRPGNNPLSLTWDQDNRMASADVDNDGTADVTYTFDALGRRVARDDGTANTVYVQAGQQTVADYPAGVASSAPTYKYYYASYIDEPVMRAGGNGDRYFHRNQQYSIVALTDANANVKERYAYDAYGTPTITDASGVTRTTSAENNRYLFTGREYDEDLDLYHYRARIYLSRLGRFGSRDPIGFLGKSESLYGYVVGRPLKLVDPDGETWQLTPNLPPKTSQLPCPKPCSSGGNCKFELDTNISVYTIEHPVKTMADVYRDMTESFDVLSIQMHYSPEKPDNLDDLGPLDDGNGGAGACYGGYNRAKGNITFTLRSGRRCELNASHSLVKRCHPPFIDKRNAICSTSTSGRM